MHGWCDCDRRPGEINLERVSFYIPTQEGGGLPGLGTLPKTRVNLRIRAHITTYYHLQIVITNDHRLGMALAMDNRTHSLACTVCMILTLLEPWLLLHYRPGSAARVVCDKNCRNAYITFWSLSFLILVRDDVQDVVN